MNASGSAAIASSLVRACWCGNRDLAPFSDHYRFCRQCHTLVSTFNHGRDISRVSSDESGLYGREYWFSHMENDLGFANIFERVRADLGERCLYWLKGLLKFRTPPAKVLELGSAHGAFVATLRWAGFDATGLELSPEIVSIARELFDVPILQGPIEDQQIESGSLDAIVLMDVLEHLPDPVATMRRSVELLSPGGLLLIQTPKYPSAKTLDDLQNEHHRFVEMLKEEEHLYLFSEESIGRFFLELGCPNLAFEPALFSHYDMFLAVSREPLVEVSAEAQAASLTRVPSGRLIQAALDLFDRRREAEVRFRSAEADVNYLVGQIESLEADRVARLEVISRQEDEIGRAPGLAAEVEALRAHLAGLEADRDARLEVIHRQGAELGAVPGLRTEIEVLKEQLAFSEADRAARLELVEKQGAELGAVPGLHAEIELLKQQLAFSEADRAARLELIERQGSELGRMSALQANLDDLTAELTSASEQAQTLKALLAESEAAREAAVDTLKQHEQKVARLEDDLTGMLERTQALETALRRRTGWRRFWF
jgi:2-polyprenyl-3-methyl-5-hydroxy-6-metoxy-1,4-benzoquinol methylase